MILEGRREFGRLSCGVTLAGRGGVLAKVLGRCDVMMIQSASQVLTGCFYVGRKPAAVEMAVNSIYPKSIGSWPWTKGVHGCLLVKNEKRKEHLQGENEGRQPLAGIAHEAEATTWGVTGVGDQAGGPLTRSDVGEHPCGYAAREELRLGKH